MEDAAWKIRQLKMQIVANIYQTGRLDYIASYQLYIAFLIAI